MTNDQITELAKQAGVIHFTKSGIAADSDWLQCFAELVRNQTLDEAIADVLEAGFKSNGVPAYEFIAKRIRGLKS